MKTKKVYQQFLISLNSIKNKNELENLKIKYLGRKGVVAKIFNNFTSLSLEEKKQRGKQANILKYNIDQKIKDLYIKLNTKQTNRYQKFYESLPGTQPKIGHLHIITQAIREITEIFKPLGFTRVRHPEIDWEYYAFDSLNMPKNHPARDEWETFFINAPKNKKYGRVIITPHTSNGQVREMLKEPLPIRMLNISRCGRRQMDINHIPTFYQFEGLVIDKGINIANLKGVLKYFAKKFFGENRQTRLRPYDFKFTEPSFEIDINCGLCLGKGCKFCKGGWVELGGAGMVHPNVLKAGKIDPNIYSGFAFGWGVERTYMMKSGTKLDDIRHLFENQFKFLSQF